MSRLIVTDQDNESEFHLHVGDELVLRLEAQPGTGFSWRVSGDDQEVLSQIGQPEFEEMGDRTLGGIERQVFRFEVRSLSVQRLELQYRRWYELTPSRIEKSFSIMVIIDA